MIAFGPVPSRRLGQSLGINNIPPKICSYACVYCQLGRTLTMRIERQSYYDPEKVFREVAQKVNAVQKSGQVIDYLTFVPDGEPTLDIHLLEEIELLKTLDIKIAVITNASLIWREAVREALSEADWVSMKVDSVTEDTWRKIDRPHHTLRLEAIQEGISLFAQHFTGKLVTETMLVEGMNDSEQELSGVANFVAGIKPAVAYLSVPTRPPAEPYAVAPAEDKINRAFHLFKQKLHEVELLIGYEGNAFAFTGNVEEDLLSITAVHPMREDAVEQFLQRAGSGWNIVERLIREGKLIESAFQGNKFYLRKLKRGEKAA